MTLKYLKFLCAVVVIILTVANTASCFAKPKVVASIRPLQAIVEAIMGEKTCDLLIPSFLSPHTYSLKPSDIEKINDAELIIWIGESFEASFQKIFKNHPHPKQVMTVLDLKGLELKKSCCKSHDHESHHKRKSQDPHVWLSPQNAEVMAKHIAESLSQIDPENSHEYQKNYQKFKRDIEGIVQEIRHQLQAVQEVPYMVFHDGYHYFESFFGLNNVGVLATHHHVPLSLRDVDRVVHQIKDTNVKGIFSEPQFSATLLGNIVALTGVRTGELNPLGNETTGYIDILRQISDTIVKTLS